MLIDKIFKTVYTAFGKFDTFNVYYDSSSGDVRAVSTGIPYPGQKIFENISGIEDFINDDSDLKEHEFIEACKTIYPNILIELNIPPSKWGGPREGAGRPATGAMPNRTIRMTDEEYIKVKEYLKELRKPSE